MPSLEFPEIPYTLRCPVGAGFRDLVLNVPDPDTGFVYYLDRGRCKFTRAVRATSDDIPQGDGEIGHPRFSKGMGLTLAIRFWKDLVGQEPVCGSDLVDMYDALMLQLDAMLNPSADAEDRSRVLWTPTGHPGRMLDHARVLTLPDPDLSAADSMVVVSFDSPFPYAISQAQTSPAIGGGIVNAGTANFYPVLIIDGPATSWTVANDTLGFGIVYDGTRTGAISLGGGDYAEIDTFKNSIVLNGNMQDMDAGVDPLLSTFFWMLPGNNDLEIVGATGSVLMNDAFG